MSIRRYVLLLAFALMAGWSPPVLAQVLPPTPQAVLVQDSGVACSNSGTCATWTNMAPYPSLTFQLTGTCGTCTATFEGTADGQSWFSILVTNQSSGAQASTTTTTGQYAFTNAGLTAVRVRLTARSSGGFNITLTRGVASALMWPSQPLFGAGTFTVNAIGTTSTDGVTIRNTTVSTAGVPVQMSPSLRLSGTAWKSNAAAASQVNDVLLANRTQDGSANTSAQLTIRYQTNGGGYTEGQHFDANGNISFNGLISSGTDSWIQGGAGLIYWGGRTILRSPADAQLNLENQAQTAGVGVDVSTDGTLKCRTRAQTGYCTVDALGYNISGAVAISPTAPTVSAGFGSTSPGTVTKNTGTLVVVVTVGTNAGGTTGTITFPSAPTGWACHFDDVTNTPDLTRQTGYTTTTAAFSTTVAWTTGDVLVGICGPF